ncbi:MAG: hypothetical protein LBI54_10055 [Lachnospiraceae bacterium]|jgi:hypothetical protein|nr:hypothetical protein [Lachnospiraceae bacterium]
MGRNLIGIYCDVSRSSLDDFVKTGHMYAIPYIVCTINDNNPECYNAQKPFEIFYQDMKRRDIENITMRKDGTYDFLRMPGESYKKMEQYLHNSNNKVLADLAVSVVVRNINEFSKEDENIFFFNNFRSDKLVGRLSYLYLDNNKNTFFFLYYKQEDLMTTVTSMLNDNLGFDINYFNKNNERGLDYSNIYPQSSMESLVQTVFVNIGHMTNKSEELISPWRLDVFSQGLKDVNEKIKVAKKIIDDEGYPLSPTSASGHYHAIIPRVLQKCIDINEEKYKKYYENEIRDYLQKRGIYE